METPSSIVTDLSSDLSSIGSLSPPPPFDYPSPQSSQDQSSGDPGSQQDSRKRSQEPDEGLPSRKRRKAEPRPRRTEHLNLQTPHDSLDTDQQSQLDTLLKVLRKRKKIVVIAGAGISVSAGSKCSSSNPYGSHHLNMAQYLTFAAAPVFLLRSRTNIILKLPENNFSMHPFTRQTPPLPISTPWSEACRSSRATLNRQRSTICLPHLESKDDCCGYTPRISMESIPR